MSGHELAVMRLAQREDGRINARMTRPGKDQDLDQDKTKKPTGKPAGRDARLAAALRENLRRRKLRERGRSVPAGAEAPDKPGQE